jgi:hypothetical protein
MRRTARIVFALVFTLTALPAVAQFDLPRASPQATVMQKVGVTDVTLSYARPGVKERTIWGGLVPWDQVWRAGANESTRITFSSPVKVEGHTLQAGTYSIYAIPAKPNWTIIFNKALGWGSEYDATQDVLRVKVAPREGAFQERLTFAFPKVEDDSAVLALSWEKVTVPIRIETDTSALVLQNARKVMPSLKDGDWQTPYRAANFAIQRGVALDEAAKWLDQSIAVRENHQNLSLKARLLAEGGRTREAISVGERAIRTGKAAQPPADTSATEKLLEQWKSSGLRP